MAAGEEPSSLAWKLNRLFETIHPAGRGEYSPEEVARAISESGGGSISPAYIYMLRKGQRDNPTKRHLELLASFFGVTPAYFFDDAAAERIEQQLDLLAAFRDGEVRRLATRASGLSAKSLGGILRMVDAAREIEGLPAEPADSDADPATAPDPPTSDPPSPNAKGSDAVGPGDPGETKPAWG
jgi:transcriptional regulator with XRE-family HTH domain